MQNINKLKSFSQSQFRVTPHSSDKDLKSLLKNKERERDKDRASFHFRFQRERERERERERVKEKK